MAKKRRGPTTDEQPDASKLDVHKTIGSGTAIVSAFAALTGVIVAAVIGYWQFHSEAPTALPAAAVVPQGRAPSVGVADRAEARPSVPPADTPEPTKPRERPRTVAIPMTAPVAPNTVQMVTKPRALAVIKAPVGIRLRDEPRPDAKTVTIVEPDKIIMIGEKIGDYYYAQLQSGTLGFIRADLVAAIQSGESIPTDTDGIASQSALPVRETPQQ